MSIALPGGKGPIIVAGLVGIGAIWFLMQRRRPAPASAAASQAARRPLTNPGRTTWTQDYANGMTMAELLARSVNRGFGIWSDPPRSASAAVGSAEARAAIRESEVPGYYGWSGPTASAVDPGVAAQYGDYGDGGELLDSVPGGPVYDVGSDSDANSWLNAWTG